MKIERKTRKYKNKNLLYKLLQEKLLQSYALKAKLRRNNESTPRFERYLRRRKRDEGESRDHKGLSKGKVKRVVSKGRISCWFLNKGIKGEKK